MLRCLPCGGEGWVCEDHPDQPEGHDERCGAGMPCPACNTSDPPRKPPGWISLVKGAEKPS
jgi:hypothetical protein